jgi:hypothetical protein
MSIGGKLIGRKPSNGTFDIVASQLCTYPAPFQPLADFTSHAASGEGVDYKVVFIG